MEKITMTRRELLAAALTLAVMPGLPDMSTVAGLSKDIPRRILGNTGKKVSMIGLGGAHIGKQDNEQESIRIIRAAIDGGINFMDNCWDYNGGESERRMGKALRDGYRERVFLMTKIDGRDKKTASRQLDESLKRLQTDHLDLLQFHEVIRMSDPDRIFGPGGAIEAAVEAKKAGKVMYIGFTGHKSPSIHLKMLDTAFRNNFTFDTIQMPLNVMDAHYDSFEKIVLPVALKHKVGVLGMKSMGGHFILESGVVSPVECLHYAMNLPVSVLITGCDSLGILDHALNAARSFRHMTEQQINTLLAKTVEAAHSGKYELYKSSDHFDGTARNPQWLG